MKIGLLSPHYAYNYGAVLQAFALKHYLRSIGHDTVIINRRPAYQCAIPSLLGRMARKVEEFAKRSSFGKFEKQFLQPQTRPIILQSDWNNFSEYKFDAVIVGSDQVWRDNYVFNSFGFNLFLDFVEDGVKRIAYAPSLGKESWEASDDVTDKVKLLLNKFNAISVREITSIPILKNKFGVDSQLVVDPSMLLTADEYQNKFCIPEKRDQYIAAYILDDNKMFNKNLNRLSHDAGMPVHKIGVKSPNSSIRVMLNRFRPMPSVTKWVENIANSNGVVTNSFHGMMFSIIFRKQFVVVMNNKRGAARFLSLLKMFGLGDRLIDESNSNYYSLLSTPIDFESIEDNINHWRNISIEFLCNNLKE